VPAEKQVALAEPAAADVKSEAATVDQPQQSECPSNERCTVTPSNERCTVTPSKPKAKPSVDRSVSNLQNRQQAVVRELQETLRDMDQQVQQNNKLLRQYRTRVNDARALSSECWEQIGKVLSRCPEKERYEAQVRRMSELREQLKDESTKADRWLHLTRMLAAKLDALIVEGIAPTELANTDAGALCSTDKHALGDMGMMGSEMMPSYLNHSMMS